MGPPGSHVLTKWWQKKREGKASMLANSWPNSGGNWPTDHTWSGSALCWPKLATFGFRRNRHEFGRNLPTLDGIGPRSARLGQIWSISNRGWSRLSKFGHIRGKFGVCAILVEFG